LGSGKVLKLAIIKHGKVNFKKEILEICKDRRTLNDREVYWICELSATTVGYNIADGDTGGKTRTTLSIYQYNKDGSFVKDWESASEVNRCLGYDVSGITKACKGNSLTYKGYVWSYEYVTKLPKHVDNRAIGVVQYDKGGNFIKLWSSVLEVKNYYGIGDRHIHLVLDDPSKTAKGFVWLRKSGKVEKKIIRPKSGYFGNKNGLKK